ncbi:MAG: hypothetical protein DRQ88_10460 [Epsilonproteobacteria bacterium]|nr:MAG: hypothetical protein DRQ88_10460 [Campylobacterota bacterium]RLA65833.1 MAG: hypothetical protein DRQ89_00340 [Campylobacterota bacterium]
MAQLFSFKALEIYPLKKYQSLILELKSSSIDTTCINELEIFFNWVCNHLEVNSILITSKNSIFSRGFDLHEFKKKSQKDFEQTLNKFQRLIYSMFFLPQTIIMDFKEEAREAGAEFGIGADIRIARMGAKINFDHLTRGLVPSCGGVGFLESIIPQSFARRWILSAQNISAADLLNSGFVHEFYDESNLNLSHNYLKKINEHPPIPRIQTKRSLLESILPRIERALEFESKFSFAGMNLGDWRKIVDNKKDQFSSARDLSKLLKFSERARQ